MSKAFDTVNTHILLDKITRTNIPNTITKFLANYTRGRLAYTQYNGTTSKLKSYKSGVPQGGVLSPTLFNIYTSDIPQPPENVSITAYADDLTITSSHKNHLTAQRQAQPYLDTIYTWTTNNNLTIPTM